MRGLRPTRLVALVALLLLAGCRSSKIEPEQLSLLRLCAPQAALMPRTFEERTFIARASAPDLPDLPRLNERVGLNLDPDTLTAARAKEPANPELRWVASQGVMPVAEPATSKPAPVAETTSTPKPTTPRATTPIPVSVNPPSRPQSATNSTVMVGGVPVPVPSNPMPTPIRPPTIPGPPPLVIPATTTAEPPIRLPEPVPEPPSTLPPLVDAKSATPQVPVVPPLTNLPTIPSATPSVPLGVGTIEVGGKPLPYSTLTRMIDGHDGMPGLGSPGTCSTCEGGACGPGQCRAGGGGNCQDFEAVTPVGRFVKLVYQCVCCPDPCYRPHWEPIADAAFFTDAPRPVTQTRVRWDYSDHLIYPDRGEFLIPRSDGSGKGLKPNAPARGIPYLDYHQLSIQAEAAAGPASVTIVTPYNSLNPTPFGESAAGFGDMTVTAKNILYDCELFIFSFQMRTYIPSGNFSKALGVGHMSLEPGLISGIRLSQCTYAVAQVAEWIPLGGDTDYQGAHLRFNFSLNHIIWQPVKDVQFIGTLEMNGINWQDGAFTDAVDGSLQKLSGQTAIAMGCGGRLFFCDKFDAGIGGMFGITGKYWAREQMRFEVRYRF